MAGLVVTGACEDVKPDLSVQHRIVSLALSNFFASHGSSNALPNGRPTRAGESKSPQNLVLSLIQHPYSTRNWGPGPGLSLEEPWQSGGPGGPEGPMTQYQFSTTGPASDARPHCKCCCNWGTGLLLRTKNPVSCCCYGFCGCHSPPLRGPAKHLRRHARVQFSQASSPAAQLRSVTTSSATPSRRSSTRTRPNKAAGSSISAAMAAKGARGLHEAFRALSLSSHSCRDATSVRAPFPRCSSVCMGP